MPSGEKRAEFVRKVGSATFKVVAICPTGEQIQSLYDMEAPPEKEPEYIGEKDTDVPDHMEGGEVVKVTQTIKNCRIDIYFQDTKTSLVTKKALFLYERFMVKKDLTKQQYINALGKTAWVDDPANLPKKFTHVLDKQGNPTEPISYHAAVMGESDLIEFLGEWLAIDRKKPYDMSINTSNLFRGNFRELQSLIAGELASLVMGVYTVRTVETEQGVQHYQDLWKKFLPAFAMKFFQTIEFTPENLKKIGDRDRALKDKIQTKQQVNNNDWLANYEKFALEITDNEYGCKDSYDLAPAHDFDPAAHYANAAATIEPSSNEY